MPILDLENATQKTLDWWVAIWTCEVSGAYLDVDVTPLRRLAILHQEYEEKRSRWLLTEIKQLEDRFGLNMLARERIRIKDEDAARADAIAAKEQQRAKPAAVNQSDRFLKAAS